MRSLIMGLLEQAPAPIQRLAVRLWRYFKRIRRKAAEQLGSARYSRTALHGMDEKLAEYLPATGVFVEAGANDGIQQSNTYYLERVRGWTGLLVEPVSDLAARARKVRRIPVANVALVSSSYKESTVQLQAAGLTSIVAGHARRARPEFGSTQATIDVPARTLSGLLDEYGLSHIDFLSLDIEGYEPEALAGLDFDRHAPTWMLVEILDERRRVESVIADRYEMVAQLSPHDFLYRRQ